MGEQKGDGQWEWRKENGGGAGREEKGALWEAFCLAWVGTKEKEDLSPFSLSLPSPYNKKHNHVTFLL